MQENYEEVIDTTTRKKVTLEDIVNDAEDNHSIEGAESNKLRYTFIENGPLVFDNDKIEQDDMLYGYDMVQFLKKNCKADGVYYEASLYDFFTEKKGILDGMGCDQNDSHSKKDRFKNSVKGVIDSMNTKFYSDVNLLGHAKLGFNYNDLAFVGALVVTYLGLSFDKEFTEDYAKETLESMAKSDDLCAEALDTFYDGLYINRKNRNKTTKMQNKYFDKHSKDLSTKEKMSLEYKLACEVGPITPENHKYAVTACGAYVRLKEYHNNKSVFSMIFHPFNYHHEYKLLKEMKGILVKKLGLSKAMVESLDTSNTTVLSDDIMVVDKLFRNDPSASKAGVFRDKERSNRDNIMQNIRLNINKKYEAEYEYEKYHTNGVNTGIDKESNISDKNYMRKKVLDYENDKDKPISVHDEVDFVCGESNSVIDNYNEVQALKNELYSDNNQHEYDFEHLTEDQLDNVVNNKMEFNI